MMDPSDAPEVIGLWDKTHTTRKARRCDVCKEMIEVGQRYQSSGYLMDGKFEHWVRHQYGEMYPSGCPKFNAVDRAELEGQFREDEKLFAPAIADTHPKDGDVKQAPLVSGGGAEGNRPKDSQ